MVIYRHLLLFALIGFSLLRCGPTASSGIVLKPSYPPNGVTASLTEHEIDQALEIVEKVLSTYSINGQYYDRTGNHYIIENKDRKAATWCHVYYSNELFEIKLEDHYAVFLLSRTTRAVSTDIFRAMAKAFGKDRVSKKIRTYDR